MSRSAAPRAVLDSDIIFSRVLHELMGRLGTDLRLLDLVWSAQLLAEAKRSLIERKHLTDDAAERWVEYLPLNFPEGKTEIAGVLADDKILQLSSDPGDHHVCALAIAARADHLFTHDRGYLRDRLAQHHVEVIPPQQFLLSALADNPRGVIEVLELQAGTWAGGRSIEELLDAISRAGAPEFAAHATGLLET